LKKLKDLKTQLKALRPMLVERYNVESIAIFGSYSRGEQTSKSDLDVVVSFSGPIGVYGFIEVDD